MITAERVQQYARETAEDAYRERMAEKSERKAREVESICWSAIRESQEKNGRSIDLTEYEEDDEADVIAFLVGACDDYGVRPFTGMTGGKYKIWMFDGPCADGEVEWRVELWVPEPK